MQYLGGRLGSAHGVGMWPPVGGAVCATPSLVKHVLLTLQHGYVVITVMDPDAVVKDRP